MNIREVEPFNVGDKVTVRGVTDHNGDRMPSFTASAVEVTTLLDCDPYQQKIPEPVWINVTHSEYQSMFGETNAPRER